MKVSMLTAGLLAILLIFLSAYVIAGRLKFKIDLGDGDNPAMQQRIRAQANFVEYVPIALILLMLVEYGGIGPSWMPMMMGGALVTGRLLHAQGLIASAGATFGRLAGTNLTALVIVGGANAVLGRGAGAW
jgi:uncharacterized membrane protein YecN with MAPEG domain